MAIKIGLDAGHGLKTQGKQTPDAIKEWTLNDKVADKVMLFLKDYDCEIIRTDNNEGNTDESLASRYNRYVNAGVAAFVSIHHNAYTGKWNNATGVEIYTDNNPIKKDVELANCIYSRLVKYTGLRGRGIKKLNFAVINQNKIPAVLVEGGFMDGASDYKYITSDAGQTAYAKAVAEGLIEFLKLEKKVGSSVSTENVSAPTTNVSSKNIVAGAKLNLKNVPLYVTSTIKVRASIKNGAYYVWSANIVNNRVRITNSTANVGRAGRVTGWIDYDDAKASVDGIASSTITSVKSIDDWAKEVINGMHGNGHLNRKSSLKKAGCPYTYAQVRARVNSLVK
jgi:hypothetical protein